MAMSARFCSLNGGTISEKRSGSRQFLVSDIVGNVTGVVDEGGDLLATTQYWPYGSVQTSTGTAPGRIRFGGQLGFYTDQESRILQGRRLYEPAMRSWLSPTLGRIGSTFAFRSGNPMDLSGRLEVKLSCQEKYFKSSDCDKVFYDWEIDWVLSDPSAEGFIVQKIDLSHKEATDCHQDLKDVKGSPALYWELWEAAYNVIYNGYYVFPPPKKIANDKWWWGLATVDVFGEGVVSGRPWACKKVEVIYKTGEACYFSLDELKKSWGGPPKWDPGDLVGGHGVANSGHLPSTKDEPNFWATRDKARCVTRTLTFARSCCCPKSCHEKGCKDSPFQLNTTKYKGCDGKEVDLSGPTQCPTE